MPNVNWLTMYLEETIRSGSIHQVCGSDDRLYITIRNWGLNFKDMFRLSELLGTKLIDVVDKGGIDGCETCGHGGYTEHELECKEVRPKMRLTDEPDHPEEKICQTCGAEMRCYHLEVDLFDEKGEVHWAPMWKKYWQCKKPTCIGQMIEEFDGVVAEEEWK